MSPQRNLFVFLTAFLLTFENVNGYEVKEIVANGYWRKIFHEENNSPVPISFTRRYTCGLKTRESDEKTVVAQRTVGGSISLGDSLKVVSVTVNYSYQRSTTYRTLTETEIHRSKEETTTYTVPPWTTLVRWQFVANIAGVEYDYDHTLTTNNTDSPSAFRVTAIVQLRKRIHFESTRIRIKHKTDGRYITVVSSSSWPAAALGGSNLYHFILYDHGDLGIRIKTLNTMYPGYEWLYSSARGGIYFDLCRGTRHNYFNGKQYWHLSKSPPLYHGDVVTIRNNYYHDSYAGRSSSWVYCVQNQADEWILEVI